MSFLILSIYDDIITDINGTWYFLNLLAYSILKNLTGEISFKIQPYISSQSLMCHEGSYVSTFLS